MRHAFRFVPLALVAGLSLAAPAVAHDRGLAGGPSASLPVDPEILPPDTRPGECVARRVTGPGGAYRWERVECDDGERGWSDFDRWSYGRTPLRVEDRAAPPPPVSGPPPEYAPDRYSRRHDDDGRRDGGYRGGSTYSRSEESYEYSRERYDSAADEAGYGAGYAPAYGSYGEYQSAGRDAYGYLVWPGKRP
ncbi:MAG: hypothetical protein QM608_17895 [Caulobacter sp.]